MNCFMMSENECLYQGKIYDKNHPTIIEYEKKKERIENKTSTLNDRISVYCADFYPACFTCTMIIYVLFLIITSVIFKSELIFIFGILLAIILAILRLFIKWIKYIIQNVIKQ